MRTTRRWRPLVVAAVVAFAAACDGAAAPLPPQAPDAPVPGGDPITVGGTLGLTGTAPRAAADRMAVYDFWVDEVNDDGGLLGRPVELLIYDDGSDPSKAASLYQRLIAQEEVDLLLAPDVAALDAVFPLAARNRMLLFNGGPSGADLVSDARWMVDIVNYHEPDHPLAVFDLIATLPRDQRPRRIGIATARDPLTRRVRDGVGGEGGVLTLAQRRGIDVVVDEEYAADAADLSGVVQRAAARDVDLFFALSLPTDAALLARAARRSGFAPDIYCSCGAPVTTMPGWSDLGPAGDDIMTTAAAWPVDGHVDVAAVAGHVASVLGHDELPVHLTCAYALLQVLEQAVQGTGSLDQGALRTYVTDRTIETVAGPIAYGPDGLPEPAGVLLQYRGDRNVVVWPPHRATAAPEIPMGG